MTTPAPAPSISIVMPALDEEEGIGAALDEACGVLDELEGRDVVSRWEILVVDDGSTDRTFEIASARAIDMPAIRVLRHDRNRGVGAGLRTAIAEAGADVLLYTDADMPVDLHALADALPLLADDGVGLIAGRRSTYAGEPRLRQVLSRLYDRIAGVAFAIHVTDANFPFKLLPVELARRLPLQADGALADLELLWAVQDAGLRVVSVELTYRPRTLGSSKTLTTRLLRQLVREGRGHRRRLATRDGR